MATAISPSGRYRMSDAARLMGISRSSLYNYAKDGTIRTKVQKLNGKVRQYVQGLEIIRYNESIQGSFFTNVNA